MTGDFDEDGLTDLAVATTREVVGGNGTVTIVLGNGDGTFQPPVDYAAGSQPYGLALGDFNEDGIVDIVSCDKLGNRVSILLGNGAGGIGDGTFGAPTHFPAGTRPFTVVAEDFDEDGILDLAVSNNGAPTGATVLRGLGSGGVGNGTFGAPTHYPVANLPAEVRSADFDEDGILDLVVAVAYAGHVALLRGQGSGGVGDGTFAPATAVAFGAEPFGMAIADWDADGILDLAVANTNSGGLRFHRGQGSGGVGNGTFAAGVIVASGNCAAATAGDINQDGILDLLTADMNSSSATPVLLAFGNGNGTFGAPTSYPAGIIPADIVVAQFDGSPRPDIAVTNRSNDFLTIRLGVCDGPTSALVSTLSPVVRSDEVELAWHVGLDDLVEVQRREEGTEWSALGSTRPDGGGILRWTDTAVRPGGTYDYRLHWGDGAAGEYGGEVRVSVPAPAFALHGLRPNPLTSGAALVRFTLDRPGEARLEVLDVAGRRVFAGDVGQLGPGSHQMEVDASRRLGSGVYVIRLTSAGRVSSARAVVVR